MEHDGTVNILIRQLVQYLGLGKPFLYIVASSKVNHICQPATVFNIFTSKTSFRFVPPVRCHPCKNQCFQ